MAGRGAGKKAPKPVWLTGLHCILFLALAPLVALLAVVLGCKEAAALREGRNVDVPSSLLGKTVVVTGASSGIGFATAIHLLKLGAHVIVHGPSEERTKRAARDASYAASGLGKATPMWADLQDFDAVRAMATQLRSMVPQVHVLILNAAFSYGAAPVFGEAHRKRMLGMPDQSFVGKFGKDRVLSINHFGHFVLTMALRPKWAADLKVVVVTGNGMWQGDWRRLVFPVRYPWEKNKAQAHLAYEDSKFANVCFGKALRKRLSKLQTVVVHDPGQIATTMIMDRKSKPYTSRSFMHSRDSRWVWWHMTATQAAERMVRAAFVTRRPTPDLVSSYWMPKELWKHRSEAKYLVTNDFWRRRWPVKFLMNQVWSFGPLYDGVGPGCHDERFQDYFWNMTMNATGYGSFVDQGAMRRYYSAHVHRAVEAIRPRGAR